MDPCMQRALMFVGAVIGAGFASGREVVSFFSSYGAYSWLFILLSTITMTALCCICLRRAHATAGCHWCAIYQTGSAPVRKLAQGCILLLQVIMGGAMISAAGHLFALALPYRGAYLLGMLVTIGLSLLMGCITPKIMTAVSGLLTILFAAAVIMCMVFDWGEAAVAVSTPKAPMQVVEGSVRAVAYAALNLALSIGAVCRFGGCSCRISSRSAVLFGLTMTGLLFVSNILYLKHPELTNAAFPMVALLARFGRVGHLISLLMMYLAILTTLSAGLFALRTGLEEKLSPSMALCMTVILPLIVAFAGFEGIVDGWYTPVGLLCLLLVFAPLFVRRENIS